MLGNNLLTVFSIDLQGAIQFHDVPLQKRKIKVPTQNPFREKTNFFTVIKGTNIAAPSGIPLNDPLPPVNDPSIGEGLQIKNGMTPCAMHTNVLVQ